MSYTYHPSSLAVGSLSVCHNFHHSLFQYRCSKVTLTIVTKKKHAIKVVWVSLKCRSLCNRKKTRFSTVIKHGDNFCKQQNCAVVLKGNENHMIRSQFYDHNTILRLSYNFKISYVLPANVSRHKPEHGTKWKIEYLIVRLLVFSKTCAPSHAK